MNKRAAGAVLSRINTAPLATSLRAAAQHNILPLLSLPHQRRPASWKRTWRMGFMDAGTYSKCLPAKSYPLNTASSVMQQTAAAPSLAHYWPGALAPAPVFFVCFRVSSACCGALRNTIHAAAVITDCSLYLAAAALWRAHQDGRSGWRGRTVWRLQAVRKLAACLRACRACTLTHAISLPLPRCHR